MYDVVYVLLFKLRSKMSGVSLLFSERNLIRSLLCVLVVIPFRNNTFRGQSVFFSCLPYYMVFLRSLYVDRSKKKLYFIILYVSKSIIENVKCTPARIMY